MCDENNSTNPDCLQVIKLQACIKYAEEDLPNAKVGIALCHYVMKQYAASLKYITEIIERAIKDHPRM